MSEPRAVIRQVLMSPIEKLIAWDAHRLAGSDLSVVILDITVHGGVTKLEFSGICGSSRMGDKLIDASVFNARRRTMLAISVQAQRSRCACSCRSNGGTASLLPVNTGSRLTTSRRVPVPVVEPRRTLTEGCVLSFTRNRAASSSGIERSRVIDWLDFRTPSRREGGRTVYVEIRA